MKTTCRECGIVDGYLQWQEGPGYRHIRCTCSTCGQYLGFVQQKIDAVNESDANPKWGEHSDTNKKQLRLL